MPASIFAAGAVAHNTYTKWMTTYPNMVGIVGGDVGDGTFAGVVLSMTENDVSAVIEALYNFKGPKHSFSALVHVVQIGIKAVITGVVTEGWMKDHPVKGEFTEIKSKLAPGDGLAYQGSIDIM